MPDVIAALNDYVETFPNRHGIDEYTNERYITDILYGLGMSLSDEYWYAEGFAKFKKLLFACLENTGEP